MSTTVMDEGAAIAARSTQPRWHMIIYLGLCHVFAFAGILHLFRAQTATLVFAFSLYVFGGLGVTAGMHRLWAHRSYRAEFPLRMFLMICASIANQGPIYHWARDHRVHHKHSDTDADPHNSQRGFFYAHMGWLLVRKHPLVKQAGQTILTDDLLADPLIALNLRLDPWFNFFWCFGFPTLVAWYFWNESPATAFFVAGALRYVWTLHCTWLVNSAAHFFGYKPYDAAIPPVENPLVSLLAVGEGWHNWHHHFPHDYSASEFGVTAQFNPTKLFIDVMAALGQVTDRKRATDAWELQKRRQQSKQDNQDSVHRARGG